jgi:hypothetical protein
LAEEGELSSDDQLWRLAIAPPMDDSRYMVNPGGTIRGFRATLNPSAQAVRVPLENKCTISEMTAKISNK